MAGIPQTLNELRLWGNNFANLITANPATYGLTAPNAVVIQGAADSYEAAYVAATTPSTNTLTTRQALRDAKTVALAIYRQYYNIIKNDPAVTTPDKTALGIVFPNAAPAPIPPPATFPQLSVIAQSPLNMTLDWRDSGAASGHAKPRGTTLCLLFRAIGASEATDPELARFYGAFTKRPFPVTFDAADRSKTCTFFGQWANAKGERGAYSGGISQLVS